MYEPAKHEFPVSFGLGILCFGCQMLSFLLTDDPEIRMDDVSGTSI